MNFACKVVTIVFRFAAVCLALHLLYSWATYLLTPLPQMGEGMNGLHKFYWESMLRVSVVKALCAAALFVIAPFLARLVTRGSEA